MEITIIRRNKDTKEINTTKIMKGTITLAKVIVLVPLGYYKNYKY